MLEVREVRRAGDIQIRKLPCRIEKIDKAAPDVAIVTLKLPANERLQYLAGQYIDFLLKDGRRRSFSLATAPEDDALLELHIRHVPDGIFSDQLFNELQGPRDPRASRGRSATFYLRDRVRQADHLRRRRYRLRADQGGHRACASITRSSGRSCSTGVCVRSSDLYLPELARRMAASAPQLHFHSRAVRSSARGSLARAARASCTRR